MTDQFILSLLVGIFIGGVAGYLGSLMVTKRMALVGDALGHVALPGVALALIYGFNVSWGALPALALGILLIWLFEIRTKIPMEALTGIVFTTSVAIAFLFLPEEKVSIALIGDISQIGHLDAIISIILAITIFLIIRRIFSGMILATISTDLAKIQKINVKKYNFIYLASIAIIVALGIKVVGSLLMGALVIIPACAARNISKNLFQYTYSGMIIGGLSCILGILTFKLIGFPAGPLIILISTFFFLISMIFKRA